MSSSNFYIEDSYSLKDSSVYVSYEVLRILDRHNKITIYELFSKLRSKSKGLNYASFINALTFLYMAGVVEFKHPYITAEVVQVD